MRNTDLTTSLPAYILSCSTYTTQKTSLHFVWYSRSPSPKANTHSKLFTTVESLSRFLSGQNVPLTPWIPHTLLYTCLSPSLLTHTHTHTRSSPMRQQALISLTRVPHTEGHNTNKVLLTCQVLVHTLAYEYPLG